MYRFKIYRCGSGLSSRDVIDKVRYADAQYSYERTINPIYNNLSIKQDQGDYVFFRDKLEGEFALVGEDYDWASEMRTDANEINKYRYMTIEEKAGNNWQELWRGFFSFIAGEYDLHNCTATFSGLQTFDKYSKIIENKEIEVNLLDLDPYTVHYKKPEYEYEIFIVEEIEQSFPSCYSILLGAPTEAEEFYQDKGYTLYKKTQTAIDDVTCKASIVYEYRRDFINQVNSPGAEWQKDPVDALPTGLFHWVRNYLGVDDPEYTRTYYGEAYCDTCTPEAIIEEGYYTLNTSELLGSVDNERARSFIQAAVYPVLEVIGLEYAIESEVLENNINPLTGEDNLLKYLRVFQLSDLRDTSDPATRGMYSFKDIESWMKLLNIYWDVNDSGRLIFEHQEYFDNGRSYVEEIIGLDLSEDPKWAKQTLGLEKFSYEKSLPRIEEISLQYAGHDDFFGLPIVYRGAMNNWGEDNKISHSVSNLTTDITHVLQGNDVGNEGFALVATENIDGEFHVIESSGALTSRVMQNMPLSVANIQDVYWRWGRPSYFGIMNRKPVNFENTRKFFVRQDITISYCDIDFDPQLLVRTPLGVGKVLLAERFLKDKKMVLSLGY